MVPAALAAVLARPEHDQQAVARAIGHQHGPAGPGGETGRPDRAEQQAVRLEQKLADLRAHAEVVETQPLLPASHPGLLRRIMSWYRRL